MISEKHAPRLLGAAFLFVLVASLASTQLYASVVGSDSMSDILVNASENASLIRLSALLGLATSAGIVVLAVSFYVVLK